MQNADGTNGDDVGNVQLCPDYMGVELGIGESLIVKAIAQSTARKPADIKTDLRKVGDLGLVAEVCPPLKQQLVSCE